MYQLLNQRAIFFPKGLDGLTLQGFSLEMHTCQNSKLWRSYYLDLSYMAQVGSIDLSRGTI